MKKRKTHGKAQASEHGLGITKKPRHPSRLPDYLDNHTGINVSLHVQSAPHPVSLAVIDSLGFGFTNWPALAFAKRVDTTLIDNLQRELARAGAAPPSQLKVLKEELSPTADSVGGAIGHGAAAAEVVVDIAPNVSRVGFFPVLLDSDGDTVAPDAAAQQIRRALKWGADVILCPWSDGQPPPLNARLLESLDLAVARGRHGRGAIVICSSGRSTSSGDSNWLVADALANHPSVLTVTACDRSARTYRQRSSRHAASVFGPAVSMCAPGWTIVVSGKGHKAELDETSLAAPLVAGAAAALLGHNPQLRAIEARGILQMCAVRQPNVDWDVPAPDREEAPPRRLNETDRQGHNSKIGYGRVDAARSCAAAVDPVCNVFEAVRLVPELPLRPGRVRKSLYLSDRWWTLVAGLPTSPLAEEYRKCRTAIVCVLQRSGRLRQALSWAARHCRTAATDGDIHGIGHLAGDSLRAAVHYGADMLCHEAKKVHLAPTEVKALTAFARHLKHAATAEGCRAVSRKLLRFGSR